MRRLARGGESHKNKKSADSIIIDTASAINAISFARLFQRILPIGRNVEKLSKHAWYRCSGGAYHHTGRASGDPGITGLAGMYCRR
jgi:hypothetical protein